MERQDEQICRAKQLDRLVKIGLIRELFRQRRIDQSRFEQLMRLHRSERTGWV